jgi:alkylation response protein AidB-like acyl-CoA dehydrogenase
MLAGATGVVNSRSSLTTAGDRCHAAADPPDGERPLVDFDDTPEEAEYRADVRRALEEHAAELLHVGAGEETVDAATAEADLRRTQRVLYEAGLVGVTWPREHGGQGGTLVQQAIVQQELARARVPALVNHIGLGMCGPTVIAHGSDDQRQRYLTRLLRADDVWCQLFSEPASGSDLAALRTTAVRDGDDWVVNGQKVWTTLAHVADHGILLARTDPEKPKHAGLTMFVVDMHAPGVTVRPLR